MWGVSSRAAAAPTRSDYVKKDDVELKPELAKMLKTFFDKMDIDGDGSVTKDEAIKFWGKNFAKVNANSMFNEVDEDGNGSVTWDEFTDFWKNVVGSGRARPAPTGGALPTACEPMCPTAFIPRADALRYGARGTAPPPHEPWLTLGAS